METDLTRRLVAEFFGTCSLIFAGCGAAVLTTGDPNPGIGFLGVSLAFGLTAPTMACAAGQVSGGHFNSAVTLGLWAAGRRANKHALPCVIARVAGATPAAALWAIAFGKPDWIADSFASNGCGDLGPGKYGLSACLQREVPATFLFIIIATTSKDAATGARGNRQPEFFKQRVHRSRRLDRVHHSPARNLGQKIANTADPAR